MSVKPTIAIWGGIVCSNVWAASINPPAVLALTLAVGWLAFAGLIVWIEARAAQQEPKP